MRYGCGHLGNNEDPGQADCHEKSTAHSEGSTEEAEAEKSKCFWKTLNMQPNKNLETLENGNEFGQTDKRHFCEDIFTLSYVGCSTLYLCRSSNFRKIKLGAYKTSQKLHRFVLWLQGYESWPICEGVAL